MVWGTHSGETVRVFKEQPQWLYISTLKQTGTQAKVLWLTAIITPSDKPQPDANGITGLPAPVDFQLTLLPGNIYRIPISMTAFGLDPAAHFVVIIREDSASKPFFRREFEVIEKPYNARTLLLQNKYGLLESFFY